MSSVSVFVPGPTPTCSICTCPELSPNASLSPPERAQWEEYRFQRLTEPEGGASICMEEFQSLIDTLLARGELSAEKQGLLQQLLDYSDTLLA